MELNQYRLHVGFERVEFEPVAWPHRTLLVKSDYETLMSSMVYPGDTASSCDLVWGTLESILQNLRGGGYRAELIPTEWELERVGTGEIPPKDVELRMLISSTYRHYPLQGLIIQDYLDIKDLSPSHLFVVAELSKRTGKAINPLEVTILLQSLYSGSTRMDSDTALEKYNERHADMLHHGRPVVYSSSLDLELLPGDIKGGIVTPDLAAIVSKPLPGSGIGGGNSILLLCSNRYGNMNLGKLNLDLSTQGMVCISQMSYVCFPLKHFI